MATVNQKFFIYVGGAPKGLDSQDSEIRFKSIALMDKAGMWFDIKADTNANGTITLSGLNLSNVGTINGRTVENDGSTLDSHISSGATTAHTIGNITGLTNALNEKVTGNTAISGETHTKITYDSKGLVTGGTNLQSSDIPNLDISKINDLATQLASKVDENASITAGTHTKISYDAKGLVTSGSDLLETDIPSLAIAKTTGLQDALDAKVSKNVAIAGGTFSKVTVDTNGLVTGHGALIESDIPDLAESKITGLTSSLSTLSTFDSDLSSTASNKGAKMVGFADPSSQFVATTVEGALDEALDAAQAAQVTASAALPLAGGQMTGQLDMNTHKIINVASPSAAGDAVNKAYVDATGAGLDFQADVKAIQTDATLNPGTPVAGDRYIIKNASALHTGFGTIAGIANNDIVQYNGSAFVVSFHAAAHTGGGVLVWSTADASFQNYSAGAWSVFGGLSGVTAGVGLTKSGNTISVLLGAGIAELPAGDVGVDLSATGGLELTDGTADAQLRVKLNGTSLDRSASGLKVGSGIAGLGVVYNTDGSIRSKASVVAMVAAETLVAGDVVIASTTVAGKVLRANASVIASCEGVMGVVVLGGVTDATVYVQVDGEVTVGNGGTGMTLGKRVFVSETTGQATSTAPVTTNSVVFMLGVASAADKVVLQPSLVIVN